MARIAGETCFIGPAVSILIGRSKCKFIRPDSGRIGRHRFGCVLQTTVSSRNLTRRFDLLLDFLPSQSIDIADVKHADVAPAELSIKTIGQRIQIVQTHTVLGQDYDSPETTIDQATRDIFIDRNVGCGTKRSEEGFGFGA